MDEYMKSFLEGFYKKRKPINNWLITESQKDADGGYKMIHTIEEDEDEYVFTAKVIVPKKSKLIKKCREKNTSPITQILSKKEKEHNNLIKDEKTIESLYFKD